MRPRLLLALATGLALLPATAPQRAQHEGSLAPQRSAVIGGCAVRYDTHDRTLSVFRSLGDCRRPDDPAVWRHVIPVASPACGATAGSCASNGADSSFRPPCVARSRTEGVSWHMSFFSGVHCDLDAASLVLQGRLDAW